MVSSQSHKYIYLCLTFSVYWSNGHGWPQGPLRSNEWIAMTLRSNEWIAMTHNSRCQVIAPHAPKKANTAACSFTTATVLARTAICIVKPVRTPWRSRCDTGVSIRSTMRGAHCTQQTAERAVSGPSFAPLPRLTSIFGACESACKCGSAYSSTLDRFWSCRTSLACKAVEGKCRPKECFNIL